MSDDSSPGPAPESPEPAPKRKSGRKTARKRSGGKRSESPDQSADAASDPAPAEPPTEPRAEAAREAAEAEGRDESRGKSKPSKGGGDDGPGEALPTATVDEPPGGSSGGSSRRRRRRRKSGDTREGDGGPKPSADLDPDKVAKFAWKIFLAEVSEEGLALIGDQDARELSRRSFRLAEVFLEEAERRQS